MSDVSFGAGKDQLIGYREDKGNDSRIVRFIWVCRPNGWVRLGRRVDFCPEEGEGVEFRQADALSLVGLPSCLSYTSIWRSTLLRRSSEWSLRCQRFILQSLLGAASEQLRSALCYVLPGPGVQRQVRLLDERIWAQKFLHVYTVYRERERKM